MCVFLYLFDLLVYGCVCEMVCVCVTCLIYLCVCVCVCVCYLFDLLALLLRRDGGGGDAEALLEHGHARLGLAALDLGQAAALRRLPALHLLDQALVVALHLLHLLQREEEEEKEEEEEETDVNVIGEEHIHM